MKAYAILPFLGLVACAATAATSAPAAAPPSGSDGMLLSQSDPSRPGCFTGSDGGSICPVTGTPIPVDDAAAAFLARGGEAMTPACASGSRDIQCFVPLPNSEAKPKQIVVEDSE